MRAKLVSGGWGFLERILKGWEQSHVPKPPSTNINLNIWVQGGLCFFARALGFEFGRFLPVPMSICILVCQITPCWNSQHCNLCGCNSVQPRGKCQPSAPSAPVQVSSFLPILSPSDFPFSGEGKLLHGWQKDLPRGMWAQSEPWPWQGFLQHLHSLPRGSAPGRGGAGLVQQLGGECGSSRRGWCEGQGEIPSARGALQG